VTISIRRFTKEKGNARWYLYPMIFSTFQSEAEEILGGGWLALKQRRIE